jgi:hypothetical protein
MDDRDLLHALQGDQTEAQEYFKGLRKTAVSAEWLTQKAYSGAQKAHPKKVEMFMDRMGQKYKRHMQEASVAVSNRAPKELQDKLYSRVVKTTDSKGGALRGLLDRPASSFPTDAPKPGMSNLAKGGIAAGAALAGYGIYKGVKALKKKQAPVVEQPAPKTASIHDAMGAAARSLSDNKEEVIGGVLGALGGTLLMRAAAKKGPEGKSALQKHVADANERLAKEDPSGKPAGFTKKMLRAMAPSTQAVADVATDHPLLGGAALGGPGGASGGILLGKLFKKLSK